MPAPTQRSWDSIIREADPQFDEHRTKTEVYEWKNGRKHYDKPNPYSGTST